MKKLLCAASVLLMYISGFGQRVDSVGEFFNDFNFISHLAKNGLLEEATREKDKLFARPQLPQLYRDSVNFFMGNAYYEAGQPQLAKPLFLAVSDDVFFYYKSRYLASIIDAEAGAADSALAHLAVIEESTNPDLNELKTFEQAGLLLLKRDRHQFDSIASRAQFNNPLIAEEFSNLRQYALTDQKIRRRSPLLAGTLSAIVPGLGKVYSGNNGQALVSFLTCGALGAAAAENFLHYGIKHPQTLFFSGLFGIFYVGNIWGSVLSVQIVKLEKQLENKHNILVGLKLPVSKFFN